MAVYVISGTVRQFWVAMSLNMGRSPPKIGTNTGDGVFGVWKRHWSTFGWLARVDKDRCFFGKLHNLHPRRGSPWVHQWALRTFCWTYGVVTFQAHAKKKQENRGVLKSWENPSRHHSCWKILSWWLILSILIIHVDNLSTWGSPMT